MRDNETILASHDTKVILALPKADKGTTKDSSVLFAVFCSCFCFVSLLFVCLFSVLLLLYFVCVCGGGGGGGGKGG